MFCLFAFIFYCGGDVFVLFFLENSERGVCVFYFAW